MTTTIYHNPRCSTSRKVLDWLRADGAPVTVIDYLKTPPDRATIRRLVADAGIPLRAAIRSKEAAYRDLGLADAALDDEALLDAIEAHPVLLERPFVVTGRGTRLARPPERVFEIMANPPRP